MNTWIRYFLPVLLLAFCAHLGCVSEPDEVDELDPAFNTSEATDIGDTDTGIPGDTTPGDVHGDPEDTGSTDPIPPPMDASTHPDTSTPEPTDSGTPSDTGDPLDTGDVTGPDVFDDAGAPSDTGADPDADSGIADTGTDTDSGTSDTGTNTDPGISDTGTDGDAGSDDDTGVDSGTSDTGTTDDTGPDEPTDCGADLWDDEHDGSSPWDPFEIDCDDLAASWDCQATEDELLIIELINQYRQEEQECGSYSYGPSPPVELNPQLECAARIHSWDMTGRNFYSHDTPEGVSASDRVSMVPGTLSSAAENIFDHWGTPEAMVEGWMNSPGHCKNIMCSQYNQAGIGKYGTMHTLKITGPGFCL